MPSNKMKRALYTLLGMVGLLASPVVATAGDSAPGHIVYESNMFAPGDNAPQFKKTLNDKYGTQFIVDLVFGYWTLDNGMPGYTKDTNIAILYTILNQRLFRDDMNGGTWLRVDLAGSWGLDNQSDDPRSLYVGGFGMCSGLHTDVLDAHDAALLEVSVKHFFAGKRAMVAAGMIKLNNYFDRVSHARFTNDNFESSGVLPLPYNNLAVVGSYELDSRNWVTGAVTRMGTRWGDNPFDASKANGFAVVGEWGHLFHEGKGKLRVSPFFCSQDAMGRDGREHTHNAVGIFGSIEYQLDDMVKLYGRAGWASGSYLRCSAEASVGATIKLIPSRPNDYLGIGIGLFKGAESPTNKLTNEFEKIVEVMYRYQINDYLYASAYYHMVMDAAYRDRNFAAATGLQLGICF